MHIYRIRFRTKDGFFADVVKADGYVMSNGYVVFVRGEGDSKLAVALYDSEVFVSFQLIEDEPEPD